jgi:hypothetical protein
MIHAFANGFQNVRICHMKLAWITGANGLIGNYLVQILPCFATRLDAFAGHH